MKGIKRSFRLSVLVWIAVAGGGDGLAAQKQCGVCHPESRVAFGQSRHAQEGVTCTDCHGGNDTTLDTEAAHRQGFKSLRDRQASPAMCAECHSDIDKMRPYNLPVDQLAVYQTSQHGRAVARGDVQAAICTDCHGVHDIRGVSDPSSSAYSRNIPATCGRCHADSSLMEPYGLSASLVAEYEGSIHGRSLLEVGNTTAPNCTTCHGVHGATPPGIGDVDKICGACHDQTRQAFVAGPHREGMLAAGLPECESCHSNHAIERHRLEDILGLCGDCHGKVSAQASLGTKMHTLIDSAAAQIEEAGSLVERAERSALRIEDYEARLEEARTYLTEALPLVHMVTIEPVEQVTRRARSIAEEVQHDIYGELDRTEEHLGLALFWFYLLMTLVILVLFKRRLRVASEVS
jgi:predicted CXXCH cytochrome family protein